MNNVNKSTMISKMFANFEIHKTEYGKPLSLQREPLMPALLLRNSTKGPMAGSVFCDVLKPLFFSQGGSIGE